MQRGFGGTAFEPVEERQDKELTLGPTMLMALAVGLLALCAVCFVAGYAVGHRGAPDSASSAPPSAAHAEPLAGNQAKPSASPTNVPLFSSDPLPADAASDQVPAGDTISAPKPAAPPAPAANQPVVQSVPQPVIGSQAAAVAPLPGAGNGQRVHAALPAAQWMVRIATVPNPEDADVLVGALRKRGYGVTAHRDANDGLMHVEVGPFANHNDAAAMRQRLLNDGYNAVVEP